MVYDDEIYLAQNIERLRVKRGLNQQELAEILQVTKGTISAWECGRQRPNIAILAKLKDFFNTTWEDLLDNPEKYTKGKFVFINFDEEELLGMHRSIVKKEVNKSKSL